MAASSSAARSLRSFTEIPGPRTWPLFGNLLDYRIGRYSIKDYHEALKDLHSRYGNLVKQKLGTKTIVHVFDPDDVQKVYRAEDDTPNVVPLQDTVRVYRSMRKLSLGLGNTNGEEWYRLRQAVQQMMLRPQDVNHYIPSVDNVAHDIVLRLQQRRNDQGEMVDLEKEVAKWILESAGVVCFDTRLGCLSGNKSETLAEEMIAANKEIFHLSGLLKFSLPIYNYISTPKWKKLVEAEDFFFGNAVKFIDNTILRIKEAQSKGTLEEGQFNFMAYLLSRKELTQKDATIVTLSLFGDGLSTTSPALLSNLYCLAKYTQAQEKAYEEISNILVDDDELTPDKVFDMPYLRSCILETFRFFPTGTEVTRRIKKDLELAGYLVPAGTQVDLNQFVNFKSEHYFDHANDYIPDRWLYSEKPRRLIHPYLLSPFGHGRRTCAGKQFAEQDLFIMLCRILQKFRLEWIGEGEVKQTYRTLLFPDKPVRIRFHERK